MECLKVLRPRMYAEKLVSAHFLFAESDLLRFAIGNELVPLSSYVDLLCTKKLLAMIAWAIGGLRKLKLCMDDEQSLAQWKVEVFPDVIDGDHLYLRRG